MKETPAAKLARLTAICNAVARTSATYPDGNFHAAIAFTPHVNPAYVEQAYVAQLKRAMWTGI